MSFNTDIKKPKLVENKLIKYYNDKKSQKELKIKLVEEELKEAGISYKVGNFPIKALGRARASMDTDGVIKVLADQQTDEILGVHMIGPRAADMIAEAVVAMEFRASAEDIARISHAHPTFTESFREAALDATAKRAIHI